MEAKEKEKNVEKIAETKESAVAANAAKEIKEAKEVKELAVTRDVVVPGELVADRNGRKVGRGAYFEAEKIFASVLGIPKVNENEVAVIPLSGAYMPIMGDRVIAIIDSVEVSGWGINVNSPYGAFLPLSEGVDEFVDINFAELSRYFDVGDIIFCKISKVTKNKILRVSMRTVGSRKLYGGIIIKVSPTKVPRIIGKEGSMIMMIKNKTKCDIYTGQNGLVWIRGDNKAKAIEAIRMIDKQSHVAGLTEKIDKLLGEGEMKSEVAADKKEVDKK